MIKCKTSLVGSAFLLCASLVGCATGQTTESNARTQTVPVPRATATRIHIDFELLSDGPRGRTSYEGVIRFDVTMQCAGQDPIVRENLISRGGVFSLPWPETCDQPTMEISVVPRVDYTQGHPEGNCGRIMLRRSLPSLRCDIVSNPVSPVVEQ